MKMYESIISIWAQSEAILLFVSNIAFNLTFYSSNLQLTSTLLNSAE